MENNFEEPFYKKLGYIIALLGFGFTVGATSGAGGYLNANPTDSELIENNKYLKEKNFELSNKVDSLEQELKVLDDLKEKSLELSNANQTLTNNIREKDSELDDLKVAFENNVQNENSTKSPGTPTQRILEIDESTNFFDGKLYVSLIEIGPYTVKLQIGSDGFESVTYSDSEIGSQYVYEGYQIRIVKINRSDKEVTVQVTVL